MKTMFLILAVLIFPLGTTYSSASVLADQSETSCSSDGFCVGEKVMALMTGYRDWTKIRGFEVVNATIGERYMDLTVLENGREHREWIWINPNTDPEVLYARPSGCKLFSNGQKLCVGEGLTAMMVCDGRYVRFGVEVVGIPHPRMRYHYGNGEVVLVRKRWGNHPDPDLDTYTYYPLYSDKTIDPHCYE